MTTGTLTVIIPACDRPGLLRRCLLCLAAQRVPVYEVIVVNDGRAELAALVAEVGGLVPVRLMRTRRIGPTLARNAALEQVRTEYVALLDDDSLPMPEWSAACIALFLKFPSVTGQAGRILWDVPEYESQSWRTFVARYRQMIYDSRDHIFTSPEFGAALRKRLRVQPEPGLSGLAIHLGANNAALRMAFVRQNGGFHPAFPTLSDREMAYRLLNQGCTIAYNPEMAVRHAHDPSLRRALLRCIRSVPYEKKLRALYPDLGWVETVMSGGQGQSFLTPLVTRTTFAERLYQRLFRCVYRIAHVLPATEHTDVLVVQGTPSR